MAGTFWGLNNITDFSPLNNWDFSKVTDWRFTFSGCTNLENLSFLNNSSPASPTRMQEMLLGCTNLTDISALSNWNTANTTDMSKLFYGDTKLVNIDAISNWNTSRVERTISMFEGATNINGKLTLRKKPDYFSNMFKNAATGENASLTVDYTSAVTNIDQLIATKSSGSHVSKGDLVE